MEYLRRLITRLRYPIALAPASCKGCGLKSQRWSLARLESGFWCDRCLSYYDPF